MTTPSAEFDLSAVVTPPPASSVSVDAGPAKPPVDIMKKATCVSLTIGRIGNNKSVSTAQVEVEADKTLLHISKTLLDSKELAAIAHHDGEVRRTIMLRSLPSLFRAGIYLVPNPAIKNTQQYLEESAEKRLGLVEKFLSTYAACKKDAQERLKGLYNPADYPPVSRVRALFVFDWQWVSFSTPGTLKEISAEFFAQEQEKAAAKWNEATEEIRTLLRASMKGLVDHLVEKLSPAEDGTKKVFRNSTVKNLTEFLESFSIRNVTEDDQLAMLVKDARNLISGMDPDDLRKNEAARDGVLAGFSKVKDILDGLVIEGGSRKIVLDEVEEVASV